MNPNRYISSFILLFYGGISFVLSYLLIGQRLFHLNTHQLDTSGDGFKNYFTFAYYYRYDHNLWFDGMQYPYGDLLAYADGQPLLAQLFKMLRSVGLDITNYELYVVQALPFIALFFGGIVLHSILRSFNVPRYWTFITVAFCLALSPQLFRHNAHFGLAYSFCFPLSWWLILRHDKCKIKTLNYVLAMSFLLLCVSFLHPYHLLISGMFIISLFIIQLIAKRSFNWPLILSFLIPLVAYYLISSGMDPYETRTANPYGLYDYKTEFSDLIPFYGWIDYFRTSVYGLRHIYHEGYCYPGMMLFLFPVLLIILALRKTSIIQYFSNWKYLVAAFLCLLFGMGIHLLIANGIILEWLKPLKQFRGLGRFSWAFYYVFFISTSAFLYKWTQSLSTKYLKWGIPILLLLSWSYDAYSYTHAFQTAVAKHASENLLKKNIYIQSILENKGITPDHYQAVLPLPLPIEGAEKIYMQDDWLVKMLTIPYVFQTGTPMFGAYMSRLDLSSILKQLQLTSSLYINKEIAVDLDKKPILIVINKNDLLIYEDLISKTKYIGSWEDIQLHEAQPDSLTYHKIVSTQDIIHTQDALSYNGFEIGNDPGLFSKNAIRAHNTITLADISLDSLNIERLNLSLWYKVETDKSKSVSFEIQYYNQSELIKSDYYSDKSLKRREVLDSWIQCFYTVDVPKQCTQFKWNIIGGNVLIDHALVTMDSTSYFQPLMNNKAIFNHHIVDTETIQERE